MRTGREKYDIFFLLETREATSLYYLFTTLIDVGVGRGIYVLKDVRHKILLNIGIINTVS